MSLVIVPSAPVEGGPLTVRFDGPFPQPAPRIILEIQGRELIATVIVQDYVIANQPAVPFVEVTTRAPVAGDYVLIQRYCGGLPPPPIPACSLSVQQGFTVREAHAVPADAGWAIALLACGALALAAQRIERARTAFERLRV